MPRPILAGSGGNRRHRFVQLRCRPIGSFFTTARTNSRAVSLRDWIRLQFRRKKAFCHMRLYQDAVRVEYRQGTSHLQLSEQLSVCFGGRYTRLPVSKAETISLDSWSYRHGLYLCRLTVSYQSGGPFPQRDGQRTFYWWYFCSWQLVFVICLHQILQLVHPCPSGTDFVCLFNVISCISGEGLVMLDWVS